MSTSAEAEREMSCNTEGDFGVHFSLKRLNVFHSFTPVHFARDGPTSADPTEHNGNQNHRSGIAYRRAAIELEELQLAELEREIRVEELKAKLATKKAQIKKKRRRCKKCKLALFVADIH